MLCSAQGIPSKHHFDYFHPHFTTFRYEIVICSCLTVFAFVCLFVVCAGSWLICFGAPLGAVLSDSLCGKLVLSCC